MIHPHGRFTAFETPKSRRRQAKVDARCEAAHGPAIAETQADLGDEPFIRCPRCHDALGSGEDCAFCASVRRPKNGPDWETRKALLHHNRGLFDDCYGSVKGKTPNYRGIPGMFGPERG